MIIYIADFNLPNNSAYVHQVIKMCDAFAEQYKNVLLLVKYKNDKLKFKELKKNYLLKNSFKINSVLNLKSKNFLLNLIFCFMACLMIKKKYQNDKIITRSFLTSVFLSYLKIIHILEIHQELRGLTGKIFFNYYKNFSHKYLKIIYINKNLKKYYKFFNNKNSLVLDDAVDYRDFINLNKDKKKSCLYTGSLSKGKGFEIIYALSKKLKKVDFHVYGDLKLLEERWSNKKLPKNLFLKGFVTYNKIPSILKSSSILLLPYMKKSFGRNNNLNLSNYMSPLKLFDYLAAGRVIIASDLTIYSHILINNYNSIKILPNNIQKWIDTVETVLKNYPKYKMLRVNAKKNSYKFSWIIRTKKIIDYYEKK